jgi:hypothetical protein
MQANYSRRLAWLLNQDESTFSPASKTLMVYGALMCVALGLTYLYSLGDERALRGVGIWNKPMKFMAATALFAWTTVWVTHLANAAITHGRAYKGIGALLLVTSLFEVAYISYQAAHGSASHYNTSDFWHAMLFGLLAIAAVGLTATQGWLAWEIWKARSISGLSITAWAVIIGLTLTFVLSTISGFLLGGNQPPAGPGLPVVGWHLHNDIRPSHFLGVHAQQFIPFLSILAIRFAGIYPRLILAAGSSFYVVTWGVLTWSGLST